MTSPVTVVETPGFLAAVRKLITEEDRALLIDYLALNPTAGDLIPGTGGIRKLRWALEGRGKRGGARVIYYFHDVEVPLFVLTAYAKNARGDLSQDDKDAFRTFAATIAIRYKSKHHGKDS